MGKPQAQRVGTYQHGMGYASARSSARTAKHGMNELITFKQKDKGVETMQRTVHNITRSKFEFWEKSSKSKINMIEMTALPLVWLMGMTSLLSTHQLLREHTRTKRERRQRSLRMAQ